LREQKPVQIVPRAVRLPVVEPGVTFPVVIVLWLLLPSSRCFREYQICELAGFTSHLFRLH